MRRSIYLVPIFLILVAATVFWWWTRPRPVLSVMTWSGAYGRAQAAAQMQAYGAEKHVDVRIQQWADNGTLEELRRAMAAQRAGDVVDLEMPVAVAACRAGLLEPVDTAALPPGADGAPADKDFYKGMIGRCFVASALYARMLVCAQPCGGKTMAEIFADAAEGGIGLQKTAKANLEMALLADGVAPKDVYPLLETDAGLDRAFARLDAIKAHIIWSADAVPLLRRGQIRFATALTAPVQADGTAGLSL
jgi:putative spermidine/putrescine transport system substrate-binding protein